MSTYADDDERPNGAIETALWCNVCMLPSACRWNSRYKVWRTGRWKPTTVVVCEDCGAMLDKDGNPL
jgi:hypothetical protein